MVSLAAGLLLLRFESLVVLLNMSWEWHWFFGRTKASALNTLDPEMVFLSARVGSQRPSEYFSSDETVSVNLPTLTIDRLASSTPLLWCPHHVRITRRSTDDRLVV